MFPGSNFRGANWGLPAFLKPVSQPVSPHPTASEIANPHSYSVEGAFVSSPDSGQVIFNQVIEHLLWQVVKQKHHLH